MATKPSLVVRDHLRPRLETIRGEPPQGQHELAPGDGVFQPGAPIAQRPSGELAPVLVSRNGRDHARRFGGIAAAVARLSARSLVLDSEVAIYDAKLRSRFDWLREPDATPFLAICVYSRSLARLHAISMPHC